MAYVILRQIFGPSIRNKIKKVEGEEYWPDKPPFVIAGNHEGYLDALALAILILERYKRPPCFLTTPKMWRIWGKYLARKWLSMIPIQEGNKEDSLREAMAALRQGNIIGIFPEGRRNTDTKNLLKGKTGAVRMALMANVPLIPFGLLNNTGHRLGAAFRSLWQDDKFINFFLGQPVDLTDFKNKPIDKMSLEAATRKLMLAIGQLCGKSYPF